MALKVKAVERLLKFTKDENDPGVYRYVMKTDLYTSLTQAKVIREAALRSKAVEKVEDVKTSLIESRRIIFTPSVDLKDELANTSIQITCIDRNGDIVKRVTSTSGDVEDPDASPSPSEGGGSNPTPSTNNGDEPGEGD